MPQEHLDGILVKLVTAEDKFLSHLCMHSNFHSLWQNTLWFDSEININSEQ